MRREPRSTRLLAAAGAALLSLATFGLSACGAPAPSAGDVDRAPSPPASSAATGGAAAGWTRIADGPLSARQGGLAVWLRDRFLVLGGSSDPACPSNASCVGPEAAPLRDGAAYLPSTGTWRRIAAAPFAPEYFHVPVVVGRLLYLSRQDATGTGPRTLVSYDSVEDRWATLPFPPVAAPQLLAAGDDLLAFSQTERGGARFDPAAQRWVALPDDPLTSTGDRRAVWADGRLLLASPVGPGAPSKRVELAVLDAGLHTWRRLPSRVDVGGLPEAVGHHVAFWYCLHECPEGETLDLGTGRWSAVPPAPAPSATESRCATLRGVGAAGGSLLWAGRLFDPAARRWSALPALPERACANGAVTGIGVGAILVWGGTAPTGATGSARLTNRAGGYLLALPQ